MIREHGGNIFQYKNVIDFSSNLNPLGMPDNVKKAVMSSADFWECYPDPDCTELVKKLSEYENISDKNIVCGNGADDLIFRAVHALRPKKAVLAVPSFSEYEKALKEVDCEICRYFPDECIGFVLDSGILNMLDSDVDMVILCSPNNPTGRIISTALLEKISEICCRKNIILICDECFLEFAENGCEYSLRNYFNEKCIILKAFTKIFAMAGLRLGYMICGSEFLAQKIKNSGQYWSVSSPAQTAGIAAIDEKDFIKKTAEYVKKERIFLAENLSELGVTVYPSEANFLLLKTEFCFADKMLGKGILVRSCSNYVGLNENFFRIAVRTHEENMQLIEAVRRCVNG